MLPLEYHRQDTWGGVGRPTLSVVLARPPAIGRAIEMRWECVLGGCGMYPEGRMSGNVQGGGEETCDVCRHSAAAPARVCWRKTACASMKMA